MTKSNKILRVVTAAAIAVASITMIILSIINLVSKKDGASETLAFRIIACVLLIFASILSTCLVVSKDPRHFDSRLVVYNGVLLGIGIFVVLPAASDVADIFVGYLIPCILIGLGAFFIIASIISLANKINKKNTDIVTIILGLILLTAGILLVCFAKEATRVMWLLIGIILLISSVVALVKALKKEEDKSNKSDKPEKPEEKKEIVEASVADTDEKN